ncbi:MAG: UPF0149 family protein [Pseudomonadota bacterium]
MTGDSTAFQKLQSAILIYPGAMEPSTLHGFLTGMAIGPDEIFDQPRLAVALGLPAHTLPADIATAVDTLAAEAVDDIIDELMEGVFEPQTATERRDGHTLPRTDLWCQGFVKACELSSEGWGERMARSAELAKQMLILNVIADPECHGSLLFSEEVPFDNAAFLADLRSLAGPVINKMEEHLSLDEEGVDEEAAIAILNAMMTLPADKLRELSEQGLMLLIVTQEDRLPRTVVDECVRRGSAMLPLLAEYLENEQNWSPDAVNPQRWALLHCIFILGAMDDPPAAAPLVSAFKRMREFPGDDLWDWIGAYWPILFRNKQAAAVTELRRVAEDPAYDWYPRSIAMGCVVAVAHEAGAEPLEDALDWVASIAANDAEDEDTRYFAGSLLLDFPRERHRALLESLALQQQDQRGRLEIIFDINNVRLVFERGDQPEWERFADPWCFYDPEEIENRQRRWAKEDAWHDDAYPDDFTGEDRFVFTEPYVREQPKVGRNDPCPCGSGKKYKKCCLQ